jgi:hypothetical protein
MMAASSSDKAEGGRAILPGRFRQGREPGWRKPAGGHCCTRPNSRFANRVSRPAAHTAEEHLKAREAFRVWAMAPEQAAYRDLVRRELGGRDLGCYCPLDLACHVDVLLEIANG